MLKIHFSFKTVNGEKKKTGVKIKLSCRMKRDKALEIKNKPSVLKLRSRAPPATISSTNHSQNPEILQTVPHQGITQ